MASGTILLRACVPVNDCVLESKNPVLRAKPGEAATLGLTKYKVCGFVCGAGFGKVPERLKLTLLLVRRKLLTLI